MYMCACVYMYVGKHVYVFSSVWKPELVCCPWSCSSCFLIQGFWFLNRFFGSPVWLGWLAREPQESLCFHVFDKHKAPHPAFCMDARDQTQACMSENFLTETSPQPQLWTILIYCVVTLELILYINLFWCLSPRSYSFFLSPYLTSTDFWLTLYKNQL